MIFQSKFWRTRYDSVFKKDNLLRLNGYPIQVAFFFFSITTFISFLLISGSPFCNQPSFGIETPISYAHIRPLQPPSHSNQFSINPKTVHRWKKTI